MALNSRKSVLVPVSEPLSEHLINEIRAWISRNLPPLQDIKIAPTAKYLGAHLGPGSLEALHKSVVSKWNMRANEIARMGQAPSISIPAYNVHAASCCTYLMQFSFLPGAIFHKEIPNIARLLKIPCRGYGNRGPFHLSDIGMKNAVSLADLNLAVLTRAASQTLNWKIWPSKIRAAAEKHFCPRA